MRELAITLTLHVIYGGLALNACRAVDPYGYMVTSRYIQTVVLLLSVVSLDLIELELYACTRTIQILHG